jgi:hypothetical protein
MIDDPGHSTDPNELETQRAAAIEAAARGMFEFVGATAIVAAPWSWDVINETYRTYWHGTARACIAGFLAHREARGSSPIDAMVDRILFESGVAPKDGEWSTQQGAGAGEDNRAYWRKMARAGLAALREEATSGGNNLLAIACEYLEQREQINELSAENARLLKATSDAFTGMLEAHEQRTATALELIDRDLRDLNIASIQEGRPTDEEMVRYKALLCLAGNATSNYIDLAVLTLHLGHQATVAALAPIDRLYPNEPWVVLTQLVKQLADPRPSDTTAESLEKYKAVFRDWQQVADNCRALSAALLDHLMMVGGQMLHLRPSLRKPISRSGARRWRVARY